MSNTFQAEFSLFQKATMGKALFFGQADCQEQQK
jgi:hypothetical protein